MEDILFVFMVTALLMVPIMRRDSGFYTMHDNNSSVNREVLQVNIAQPVLIESTKIPNDQVYIKIEDLPQEKAA